MSLVVTSVRAREAGSAVSFVVQIGAMMAGIYVYLWIAASTMWEPATPLGIVIGVIGLGATVGPQSARSRMLIPHLHP